MWGRWIIGPIRVRRFSFGSAGIATFLLLLTLAVPSLPFRGAAVGAPLYPDLRTLSPKGLYFERSSDGRYRIRFDNTVGNYGGRLEITVDSNRDIYQNVYDKNTGGSRAIRKKVTSDLIFHPEHNHFHFANFARYELLERDDAGLYRVKHRGSKTTFCILDYIRLTSSGPANPQYSTCGATVQGLSAGWGDTYYAGLPDQSIEIGRSKLVDGDYAIRSTADPDNLLLEKNDENNVGITYFAVRNGEIVVTGAPALCSVAPDRGQVGTTLKLNCTGFGGGETVDLFWGNTAEPPLKHVKATSGGAVTASVVVPASDIGNHYVIARGRSSDKQAAALFNTQPSVVLSPTRGVVGTSVRVSLRGFSAGEKIAISYQPGSGRATIVANVHATSIGSASVIFEIPNSVVGSRTVKAVGQSSDASASATFSIVPSMHLVPSSTAAGGEVSLSLRGFGAREKVNLRLASDGTLLGTVTTNNTGSTAVSDATLNVPASLAPGTYQVVATGATSGATDRATLRVTASVTVAEESTPPPTATPTATASLTALPTATPTAVPTVVPSPTPEATVTPERTAEPVDTGEDEVVVTASEQPEPSPTSTETPEPEPENAATPGGE